MPHSRRDPRRGPKASTIVRMIGTFGPGSRLPSRRSVMSVMWYVLLALILLPIAYALGFLTARVFHKPTGPDRRTTDRRTGDRRGAHEQHGTDALERRQADRRRGERRKPRPLWPSVSVVVATLVLSGVAALAYAESQVESFFARSQPELIGAGWADCETPITWSVDSSRLRPDQATAAVSALRKDFSKWSTTSGLNFRFAGEVPVSYDDSDFSLSSVRHPSERHIFIAFLPNDDSSLLDSRTVGFAMPTDVMLNGKEIVEGSIVLSSEYVTKVANRRETALYLHEIGHALGLGHGTEKADVMYYIVDRTNELSPADIAGIRAIIQACKEGQPLG